MRAISLGILAVAGGALTVALAAQGSRPQNDDVLAQLLVEVRGLRAAMEQMASAGPRVQLALGRVQLQEQRIVNQVRRLDEVRANLVAAQNEAKGFEGRVREIEATIRDHLNSHERQEAEQVLPNIKAELALKLANVQRLTTEEAMLAQDINTEQARWTDFNRLLEELERTLAKR
jgi:chromosome segregation ATPase